ncbi:MAG: hypothetical protein NT067_00360 [Candidatus Diapherotrites archaeon]|nr:hypothetical protein [Candidatus Diapherotrites archaeon]
MRSKRTDEQLEQLKQELGKQIDVIENAILENDFKAKESALCSWCEFAEFCPKQKHILETSSLAPKEFLENDGVKLVNKYVHLEGLKKDFMEKIDPELEAAKKELFEFSKQKNVQKIAGSDFTASLASYPQLSFPPEQREQIKRLLEEAGKLGGVEDINYYELAKKLNSNAWGREFTEKILKLAIKGENRRVYLNKSRKELG